MIFSAGAHTKNGPGNRFSPDSHLIFHGYGFLFIKFLAIHNVPLESVGWIN